MTDNRNWRSISPRIDVLEVVESTNAEAMRRAAAGECGPLWISAHQQSNGRGRLDRTWQSPPGNLYQSLIAATKAPASKLPQLSLAAGIGAFDAVQCLVGGPAALPNLSLKWPNDLMVGASKLGGILIQSTQFEDRTIAVVGVGLNISAAPTIEGRATTSLAAHGHDVSRAAAGIRVAQHIEAAIALWQAGAGITDIIDAWLARTQFLGQRIRVSVDSESHDGIFTGLDQCGALLLESSPGRTQRFEAGEISLTNTGSVATGRK